MVCLTESAGEWTQIVAAKAADCHANVGAWWAMQEEAYTLALGMDPQTILYVYSWGAGGVLLLWSLGYAVGVGTSVIRRV